LKDNRDRKEEKKKYYQKNKEEIKRKHEPGAFARGLRNTKENA
jgi:hypothetical protein